jgi:hypothetical protein
MDHSSLGTEIIIGGMSDVDATRVGARCRKDATDGFVDRGGVLTAFNWGVPVGEFTMGNDATDSATVGDWRGDAIGVSVGRASVIMGGRSGVEAIVARSIGSGFASTTGISIGECSGVSNVALFGLERNSSMALSCGSSGGTAPLLSDDERLEIGRGGGVA